MKNYICLLFFVSLLTFGVSRCLSQTPTLEWATRYTESPAGYEQLIKDVITDSAGNTYITGYQWMHNQSNTSDGLTLKINSSGIIEWARAYNSTENKEDAFNSIAIDKSGNVYVTGLSDSTGTSLNYITIKYDNNGNITWLKKYDSANSLDKANDIAIDDNRNVYVTGNSYLPGPNSDFCTIKYDSAGNQQWTRFYGGSSNMTDIAYEIAVDNNDNIIVVGNIVRINSVYDIVVIKYTTNGLSLWQKIYSGINNSGASYNRNSLFVDDHNNFYFICSSSNASNILKYNSEGDSIWIKNIRNDVLPSYSLCNDKFNNIYIAGTGIDTNNRSDCRTVKYDSNSTFVWQGSYANSLYPSSDIGSDLIVDKHGNVYTTGYNDSLWLFNDFLTLKYDSTGILKWAKRYSFAQFSDDRGFYISLDSLNNIYVTGITAGGGPEFAGTITTIKYSQPPNGIVKIGNDIPKEYKLFQNYPNPFNPVTNIKYQLVNNSNVLLQIFDITGRQVEILVNGKQEPGTYRAEWDVSEYSSGIYFYRLIVDGNIIDTKKLTVLK